MRMALICAFGIAVFIGFGEGITWLAVLTLAAAAVFTAGARLLSGLRQPRLSFHGHGNTYWETVAHERRHARLLNGTGVGVAGRPKVWKNGDGTWEGVTYPANKAKWKALSPEEQAAVYLAGSRSLGRDSNEYGVCDDLEHADALSARGPARRIARRHLGWFA